LAEPWVVRISRHSFESGHRRSATTQLPHFSCGVSPKGWFWGWSLAAARHALWSAGLFPSFSSMTSFFRFAWGRSNFFTKFPSCMSKEGAPGLPTVNLNKVCSCAQPVFPPVTMPFLGEDGEGGGGWERLRCVHSHNIPRRWLVPRCSGMPVVVASADLSSLVQSPSRGLLGAQHEQQEGRTPRAPYRGGRERMRSTHRRGGHITQARRMTSISSQSACSRLPSRPR